MSKTVSDAELRQLVRLSLLEEFKTLTAASEHLPVTPQHLSRILNGRARMPEWLAKRVGYRQVLAWQRDAGAGREKGAGR